MEEKNKHLTYENRQYLENGLSKGRKYTDIANDLNKDRRTIIREIRKHRIKKYQVVLTILVIYVKIN